jgi:hypothetical protein
LALPIASLAVPFTLSAVLPMKISCDHYENQRPARGKVLIRWLARKAVFL